MHNTIRYIAFVISSLLVILIFVTAQSYDQLILAVALYAPVAYFAFTLFRPKPLKIETPPPQIANEGQIVQTTTEHVDIADVDKRAFLKAIGLAGVSFFLFSFLNKKGGLSLLGGQQAVPSTLSIEDTTGKKIDPSERQPTDGYKIAEIDDNEMGTYYGFTNKDGAWFIMKEDTDSGSFRYIKGDSDFSGNWSKREQTTYDYYHNIF